MSCGDAGRKRSVYTGNQVGLLNYVGLYNYVAGGPAGTGLSSGTTITQFIPKSSNRAVWKRKDAVFNDALLDAAYPTIDLQWIAEITLGTTTFRVSDRSFYVQDKDGIDRYYDARCDAGPQIQVDVGEWLQPNYQVSDLNMELNNRDGFFNPYLPMGAKFRQWTGAKVVVKIGFGELYSNYFTLFEGQVADKQGIGTTRDTILLKVYDKLTGDNIPMPPNYFSSDNYPDIDTSYASKPVPLIYGDWSEDVPTWGSINGILTNANEDAPDTYSFKVSDVGLTGIDSVWLHRGDRAADKPQGPIRVADNILDINLDEGTFSIPSAGVVLDEPYFITDNGKVGAGSGLGLITSDTSFDFLAQGVKIGDKVINGTLTQATVTQENLTFKTTTQGAAGNGFEIDYVLMTPVYLKDGSGNKVNNLDPFGQPLSIGKCYATKTSSTQIQVGIVQYYNDPSDIFVKVGKKTASAIKSAIEFNLDTNALIRVATGGDVPMGYPDNTRVTEVDQTVPAGPLITSGGQDASVSAIITSVANFQIAMSGSSVVFNEGDQYSIATVQYGYQKDDKFSVVCRGKALANVSTNRLYDVSPSIQTPDGLAIDFDGTYWLADNATQVLYHVNFSNEILGQTSYSDLDSSITDITGLSITNNGDLWIVDQAASQVYRYDPTAESMGLILPTSVITGTGATLSALTGIAVQPNNQFWLADKDQNEFYLVDAFAASVPFVVRKFSATASDGNASEITDIAYDAQNSQLCYVDRSTNQFYRIDQTTGALISTIDLTQVNANMIYTPGLSLGQDGTLFFLDAGNLAIYNYNSLLDADNNPALIARDLIQGFGGHTFDEFDLSWNETASQLSSFRARLAYDKDDKKLVEKINELLGQYNVVFHLRYQKYSLFWITFDNFRTTGRLAKEKDIVKDSFTPEQEFDQYFNAVNGNTAYDSFTGNTALSDSYISTAAISFAGSEVDRTLDLPNIYRRADVDKIMPLYVRLSAAEPEFVDVTFGFRLIRTQIQDFITLNFSDDGFDRSGRPTMSGRRFSNVPCMVRSLTYDLDAMTVAMKLWSLGGTSFPGYTAPGVTVGGATDPIVLSNLGRAGRVSPVATITTATTDTVTVPLADGSNAQTRADLFGRKAWVKGYKCDLIDAATKNIVQTLTIDSVAGSVITFVEDFTTSPIATTFNAAGFATGGHLIQYSTYDNLTQTQLQLYASFAKPTTNYPTTHTQELQEQRSGLHGFDDGGQPYVLYPEAFVSS